MQIQLLIIGTAFDGPSGTPVKASSIEEAFGAFGAYAYRNIALTATQTSFTIPETEATKVEFFTRPDGILTPFYDITVTSVTEGLVTIEQLGKDTELIVRYLRPFSSDDTLVYKAYAEAVSSVPDADIWMMRVGGSKAKATIGTGPAKLILSSRYAGSLYNEARVITATSSVTVQPPHGMGGARTYTTTGKSVEQIASEINTNFLKGYSPIFATSTGSGPITLTSASIALTGGTDGPITGSQALDDIGQLDTRGIKVIHIAGMRYASVPENPTDVNTVITDDMLTDASYPTLYVQGVVYDEDDQELLPSAYVDQISDNKAVSRASLAMVVGDSKYSYSNVDTYWASAAPAWAAAVARADSTALWKPVNSLEMRPYFSEDDLNILRTVGYGAFTFSLSKGWVVFSDMTSHAEWPSPRHLAYLSLVDVVYPILEPIVGSRISSQQDLQAKLENAISALKGFKASEVRVAAPNSQVITVEIVAQPYGAVGAIKLGVAINANTSG